MKIGFTGTRQGMTEAQKLTFGSEFKRLQARASERMAIYASGPRCVWKPPSDCTIEAFHHGDCLGADVEASRLVRSLPNSFLRVVAHPCNLEAQCAFSYAHEYRDMKKPLERNRDIVNECDVLFAAPGGMVEERRSGTWATIRYARKQEKPLCIVWPDGTTTQERTDEL